jgi:hypothetical protein
LLSRFAFSIALFVAIVSNVFLRCMGGHAAQDAVIPHTNRQNNSQRSLDAIEFIDMFAKKGNWIKNEACCSAPTESNGDERRLLRIVRNSVVH